MEVHPREKRVKKAEADLRELLHELQFGRDLTEGEYLRVLGVAFESASSWAKYQIRKERHGDVDKPGGIA